MSEEFIREELKRIFDKANKWPSTFNCAVLGGYLLRHPELIELEKDTNQIVTKK